MTANKLASALAIGAIAVLPACSMMGNRNGGMFGQSSSSRTTPTSTAVTTQEAAVSPDMIKAVQQKMQHDGEYHGNIDGVWGRDTQTAVRDFQRAHNLNVSGQLDQQTLQAMNLQNTNANSNYSNARSSGPSGGQASSNYNNPNNNPNTSNTNNYNNTSNQPSNQNH